MSSPAVFDQPSITFAVDGEVVVSGPAGVGYSLTPAAARETANRLVAAADEAENQQAAGDEGAEP